MHTREHIYACTHVHMYMYVSAHVHVYVCISVCACMSTGLLVWACTHTCICVHVRVHTCVYMHMCICLFACMCMFSLVGSGAGLGSVAMDAVSPALASVSSGITLHLGWGWFSRGSSSLFLLHFQFQAFLLSQNSSPCSCLSCSEDAESSWPGLEVWWWEVHFPGQPQAQVAQVPALWANVLSGSAPLWV